MFNCCMCIRVRTTKLCLYTSFWNTWSMDGLLLTSPFHSYYKALVMMGHNPTYLYIPIETCFANVFKVHVYDRVHVHWLHYCMVPWTLIVHKYITQCVVMVLNIEKLLTEHVLCMLVSTEVWLSCLYNIH